jgi:hypothetical protein
MLIEITCKCGHHGLVARETLPRILACLRCGHRQLFRRGNASPSKHRPDELIRIADGRTTVADDRAGKAASVKKTREKKSRLRSLDSANGHDRTPSLGSRAIPIGTKTFPTSTTPSETIDDAR